jgi:molecular chaperone Hsp33
MDELLRAISADGAYRIAVARTTDAVAEAVARHRPTPVVATALARALTGAALLSVGEKDFHRISVQWRGRGPLGSVQAQIRGDGSLRAYAAEASAHAPTVPEALGRGGLAVLEIDPAGRVTQGSLPLFDGSIDVDVESFLRHSEQVPSRLRVLGDGLGGDVVGVLVQTLGGAPGDALLAEGGAVAPALLDRTLDASLPSAELASRALGGAPVQVVGTSPLRWACDCSLSKVEQGVAMLGVQELLEMISLGEPGRVRCDFCAEDYVVPVERLCELVDELEGAG